VVRHSGCPGSGSAPSRTCQSSTDCQQLPQHLKHATAPVSWTPSTQGPGPTTLGLLTSSCQASGSSQLLADDERALPGFGRRFQFMCDCQNKCSRINTPQTLNRRMASATSTAYNCCWLFEDRQLLVHKDHKQSPGFLCATLLLGYGTARGRPARHL
jgi:hypothetical protein